ncbi:MAG: ABC transporter permease [Candidatus Moranbacteria bacterium]|jgi:putative ABC transport system permease protein|nr:ABC transporter permease [Candidatus Moranbacteria bacterium]MDQ5961354.1 putative transport system permease protein [Patescibacteria group bacterium]
MLLSDTFYETYSAIVVNKSRSALTILGIVIGIGSVIAMTAIGQGAQNSISANIQAIGSNLIIVRPGNQQSPGSVVSQGQGSAQTLIATDVDAIRTEADGVKAVAPEVSGRYQVTSKGKNTRTQITGVTAEYATVRNIETVSGTFINIDQEKRLAKVAVLGPETVTALFASDADPIGEQIRVNGVIFTVIGITKTRGGSGFGSNDDVIFIPITTAQQFLTGSTAISVINITATDASIMQSVQNQVNTILLKSHHITDPALADFRIMNQADIVATASTITGTLTALLGAVAGISLIVGGIGIMNMMLTSVTERTREIGLRKAIGAKRADISFQFLVEAVVLTFIGGVIGIILGWIISTLVEPYAGFTTQISSSSVMLAVGVSAAIGIVFGYYPARRASKMNAIVALRYE